MIGKWPKMIVAIFLLSLAFFRLPVGAQIIRGPATAAITDKYTSPPLTQAFVTKENSFAELAVGDVTKPTFQPQIKIKRWDNEVNFSVQLQHSEASPQVITEEGQIKWLGEKVEAHFYDTGSLKEDVGGYEFEVVLKEPPKTNVISLTIQTRGLDFFYQYPLKNLNSDGSSWEDNGHGGIRTRPAKVSGSYAVYHQTMAGDYTALGGKNYKAGKFCHIYRPRIEDAEGNWCWGELNIDEKAGLLTVTIPQEFLDKAVYPVRHAAGLEFGYHTIGGSEDYWGAAAPQLSKVVGTPASNGSLTSISIYGHKGGEAVQFCPSLYSDSSGDPATRLAYIDTGGADFLNDDSWVTTSLSYASIVAGTQYWLGLKGQTGMSSAAYYFKYDSTNGDSRYNDSKTQWENPFSQNGTLTENVSIYATYSASGGNTYNLTTTIVSVTAAATPILAITRPITSTLNAVSAASTPIAAISRAFSIAIQATTSAASAAMVIIHNLISALTALTATATAALPVTRNLSSTIAAQAAASTPALSISRPLSSAILPTSASSTPALPILRKLVTTLQAASQTATINLDMQGLHQLMTNIQAVTTAGTPQLPVSRNLGTTIASVLASSTPTLGLLHPLANNISSVTTASTPVLKITRSLSTNLSAPSATGTLNLTATRNLTSAINAVSASSNPVLSFIRNLVSTISAQDSAGNITLAVTRQLASAIQGATAAGMPQLKIIRAIQTSISGVTQVSIIILSLQAQHQLVTVVQVTTSGSAAALQIFTFPVPSYATLIVPAENRVVKMREESRSLNVPAENRTLKIGGK